MSFLSAEGADRLSRYYSCTATSSAVSGTKYAAHYWCDYSAVSVNSFPFSATGRVEKSVADNAVY